MCVALSIASAYVRTVVESKVKPALPRRIFCCWIGHMDRKTLFRCALCPAHASSQRQLHRQYNALQQLPEDRPQREEIFDEAKTQLRVRVIDLDSTLMLQHELLEQYQPVQVSHFICVRLLSR